MGWKDRAPTFKEQEEARKPEEVAERWKENQERLQAQNQGGEFPGRIGQQSKNAQSAPTIWFCKSHSGIYLKELKTMSKQKPALDVYSHFIHDSQNLEAIKMSLSRWMDK